MQPMSDVEGRESLEKRFAHIGRRLQDNQMEFVLERFGITGIPLYLKLIFEEAKEWKSYDPLPALNPDISGILHDMFERLSQKVHGQMLVSRSMMYLAAAKNGLSEDELLDVLSSDIEVYRWFLTTIYHIPEDLIAAIIRFLGSEITGSEKEKQKDKMVTSPA